MEDPALTMERERLRREQALTPGREAAAAQKAQYSQTMAFNREMAAQRAAEQSAAQTAGMVSGGVNTAGNLIMARMMRKGDAPFWGNLFSKTPAGPGTVNFGSGTVAGTSTATGPGTLNYGSGTVAGTNPLAPATGPGTVNYGSGTVVGTSPALIGNAVGSAGLPTFQALTSGGPAAGASMATAADIAQTGGYGFMSNAPTAASTAASTAIAPTAAPTAGAAMGKAMPIVAAATLAGQAGGHVIEGQFGRDSLGSKLLGEPLKNLWNVEGTIAKELGLSDEVQFFANPLGAVATALGGGDNLVSNFFRVSWVWLNLGFNFRGR